LKKRIIRLFSVLVLSVALFTFLVSGVVLAVGEVYPTSVDSYDQGTQKGGGNIAGDRSDPNDALGDIDNDFFSLGFVDETSGGWIILEFDDYVGTSITVVEQSPGIGYGYPLEEADVYVSIDGSVWTFVGTAHNQIALGSATGQSHINVFPLEECFKFVKIVDVTDPTLHSSTGDAFDIDAVWAGPCPITEIEVYVDIKPTSCPNPLNVGSNGVVSVAILGTEGFDVTQVDPATVLLEGVAPLRWSLEDVATPYMGASEDCMSCTTEGPDGFMDLVFKFNKQELVAAIGEVEDGACIELILTGSLFDETDITGSDWMKIIKKGQASTPASVLTEEPGNSGNNGKDSAPGQNKEPGEPATGKAKGKNK